MIRTCKRSFLSLLITGAAFGVVLVQAPDSSATTWWHRQDGVLCIGANAGGGSVVPDTGNSGGIVITGITSTLGNETAICAFDETQANLDTQITTISVDMYNPTGGTLAADNLNAQACVYSGWSRSCGSVTQSPAILSGGHTGLSISDLSVWTGDSGNGYAYVAINAAGGNKVSYVTGVYYAD